MTAQAAIHDAPSDAAHQDASWWRQAVVYQIYPRSFADSNGDGIGDLRGLTTKVGYLRELGVDAVWLSPFYPSALADGGYDVDDYRAVDPRIGTLEEFDELRDALHAAGIRLVVDIVPNHTSNRHVWFREALASPAGSRARERYIFRPGRGAHGELPPSDWTSIFGGPAWEPVGDGQWYLHLFAPEQPDLNWADDEVRTEFLATLKFWADRGVDGFRIDVAHALAKDLSEPFASQADLDADIWGGAHPLQDRDEVHDIYREWRHLFNQYDPPRTAVAEAWVPAHRRSRYASPDGLGQAFNFDLLEAGWDATTFASIIDKNLALARESGASSTWVLSNHDVVRHASRYALPDGTDLDAWLRHDGVEPRADEERGRRRARAATLLTLALPGSAYLYQGEELGLPEVADLPADALQDPTFVRSGGEQKGRDGCRVPLPWSSQGPTLGFGDELAHLPIPADFRRFAVETQASDGDSTLSFYRRALAERRRLLTGETLEWLTTSASVVAFTRPGGWTSVTNFGTSPATMPAGSVILSSSPLDGPDVPPETTVWLQQSGPPSNP